MRKIFVGIALMAVVSLQGCQTTNVGVCKICHPEEVKCSEVAVPTKNPFKAMDAWIQKNMW